MECSFSLRPHIEILFVLGIWICRRHFFHIREWHVLIWLEISKYISNHLFFRSVKQTDTYIKSMFKWDWTRTHWREFNRRREFIRRPKTMMTRHIAVIQIIHGSKRLRWYRSKSTFKLLIIEGGFGKKRSFGLLTVPSSKSKSENTLLSILLDYTSMNVMVFCDCVEVSTKGNKNDIFRRNRNQIVEQLFFAAVAIVNVWAQHTTF